MNKLTLDDLYFTSLRSGTCRGTNGLYSLRPLDTSRTPHAEGSLRVQLDSPPRLWALTSPLSATEDSWPLSEAGGTAGRAEGLMAMSCTDPEDVSKGSAAALPVLSKRPAPSSSSLAVAKARQNTWV